MGVFRDIYEPQSPKVKHQETKADETEDILSTQIEKDRQNKAQCCMGFSQQIDCKIEFMSFYKVPRHLILIHTACIVLKQ